MKISANIFWFAFIISVNGFGAFRPNVNSPTTIYIVERLASDALIIHVDRIHKGAATKLVLRGTSMGIAEQVKNVACDGRAIEENLPGTWSIPENCQKLYWQVPLLESETILAAKQQSVKSGNFILLSEVSSLPRLQDADATEALKISIADVKSIFPNPGASALIPLPKSSAAPLFVLINPTEVGIKSSETLKLTYFIDNPHSVSSLPNINSHMKGLRWLNTVISGKTKEAFTIAWLGISKDRMSLAGATGSDILLTNYPNDGELKFGNPMLLYIALHEAFHQFAMQYANQPGWVAESLASYYGARATMIALPNDANSVALMDHFRDDATHFPDGLVTINRKVENGDRSEYGAFYTKGLAFWDAANKMMQLQGDNLDSHLTKILQAKYDTLGNPLDMQSILGLSSDNWLLLRSRYLY